MEKKKEDLSSAQSGAEKSAIGLIKKAKNAAVDRIDRNDDGKFDLKDLSMMKDAVKASVKDRAEIRSNRQEQKKREKELETLRPIFETDVDTPGFSLPKLIRVADMDKKHAESEVCRDSIGFVFTSGELDIITIYPEKIENFGLSFYPDTGSEVYYVDPADRDHYIALDDYFGYLRVARIGELQKIAQDLGAKHFMVIYKEQKKSMNSVNAAGKAAVKVFGKSVNTEAESHKKEDSFSKIEIAAEMEFIGHKPIEPTLRYFKKDPQIQSLVSLRMADNPMTHQVYTLNLSATSGIKIKDAAQIDAALGAMKIKGGVNVSAEAQSERGRIFEYEIDF